MKITREQVLAFRVHAQELDAEPGGGDDAAILDLGVQDTGPDGAPWALALRGAAADPDDLFTAWTLRGAPHVYRRSQAARVARAVAPVSEADAAKRVFDASRPLKAAGITVLDALDRIAGEMRDIAARPVVKGEMSTQLHGRLPKPYQRWCRVCEAEHLYEQPFRLAALQGGLELQAGTSPPVLQRIPGWRGPAKRADPTLDVVRGVLRLLGPATPKQVAEYVDATLKDVKALWPDDTVPVVVDGQERSALEADLEALRSPPGISDVLALLGPFDLFLQSRDRPTVVPEEADRKDLWRTIGRPGGVLVGHEVLGTWRPRASGKKLRIAVNAWAPLPDLTEPAERLAAFRGATFDGFVDD
ncbi:MAG: crosslink repair DNA glycosylase YcaQ family protein [Marmoricola sp.]